MERILGLVQSGEVEWMSSKVLLAEVARTPDAERRRDVARLLVFASAEFALAPAVIDRASELERLGYDAFDALHFSCAEHAEVDVLLTTDDRFLRRAQRGIGSRRVRVLNRYHGGKRKYDDPLELLSDEQFERHAFEVLRRELGVDGLARFLRLYRVTNSDYTRTGVRG